MVKPTKSSSSPSSQLNSSDISSNSWSPKYKGVRKRKWGKWVTEVRLPNSRERIWLGSYDTPEKAARAFDAAQFCLRRDPAKFMNFPDNPPQIINRTSMTAAEIQVAATRFANSERILNSDLSSLSSSSSQLLHVESPSTSVSDIVVQEKDEMTEMTLNSGSVDLFFFYDFGIFSGFDNLDGDFFIPPLPNIDTDEHNYDGFSSQESFLWNF